MEPTVAPSAAAPAAASAAPSGPPRRRVAAAQVVRSERVSPSVQRVTLVGDLHAFAATPPGAHLKLFLPADPDTPLVLPTPGPDGLAYPPDAPRPVVRTYTPRRYDVVGRHLAIDVVLHGDGPAARWAAASTPGDPAGVAGPGRGYTPDPEADWFVLAGDETALSAIIGIAAALPATARAQVLVEVPSIDDAQTVTGAADLDVTWLPRDGAAPGQRLAAAITHLPVPDGDGRVWLASEAALVRRLRDDLVDRTALTRSQLTVRGYWKAGVANHPDHDYGD